MSGSRRARRLTATVGAVLITVTSGVVAATAAPVAAKRYWVPYSGVVVIDGHGYGHGRGMSQYGAEGAARAGRSTGEILDFYYPGTRPAELEGPLRVLITADTSPQLTVRARPGLVVRDRRDKQAWTLPDNGADQWRIAPSREDAAVSAVQFHDAKGWHRWQVPGRTVLRGDGQFAAGGKPVGLVLPGGTVRQYRGALRAASPFRGASSRDTVNVVSLDDYVRGVLPREMPTSWSMAALKAQAVAARTYAAFGRHANRTRYWHVCDTTSCQVYGGVDAETERGNQAVSATARRVLLFNDRPAFTQFASSSGGWTVHGGQPYLPAKADPYDDWAGNPNHDWQARVDTGTLERTFPELGRLESVAVTKRDGHGDWGGRVLQVVLSGTKGDVAMSGEAFRYALGLRSSWFTMQLTPIMRAWKRQGGATSSPVGAPQRAETRASNARGLTGARQEFSHGRMYWSKRTGARALRGAVLAYYLRAGGVQSFLGFPTGRLDRTYDGGRKAAFQGGVVVAHDRTGTHAVTGAILAAYRRHGSVRGPLGYPTTDVRRIEVGRRVRFEHGRITWLRDTREVEVVVRGD